jgi:hypothetical protein
MSDEVYEIEIHELDCEPEQMAQDSLMEKTLELDNIEEVITGQQGVNQELAVDLQNIFEGMSKLSRNVRSYTESYSQTNYKATLEDIGSMHKGVRIALWGVMIAIIAKVINFVYRAWKGNKDAKNTSERLGAVSQKLEAARNKLANTHIDQVHHLFAVHGGLVTYVNDKIGSKIPKQFSASNVKEVFNEKWKLIYSSHLDKHMCSFTKGLVERHAAYEKMIKTIDHEISHYFQVIETAFTTIQHAETSDDKTFKAQSLGFNFQMITGILTELKVPFTDSQKSPAVVLQSHINEICKVKPELAVPTMADLSSFDSAKIGKELTAFKYDEFIAKNNSFQEKVTAYKNELEGKDSPRNDEVTNAIRLCNEQIINMAQLANSLHVMNEAYKLFMDKKNAASKETIKFDISVFETIAKAKDILTAAEIKLIKDKIKTAEDMLTNCFKE